MKDFKLMKNTAYIINTARGKILKEDDLIEEDVMKTNGRK